MLFTGSVRTRPAAAFALAHVSAAAAFGAAGAVIPVDALLTCVSLAYYVGSLAAASRGARPSRRPVSRMTLYLFLATTFVLRFLLTEWVFGGFYRSAGGLGRPAMRQCIVMAVFWLHLVAVEDVSSRMESSVESNLDKGHLVAFYIWMKLGSLMGVLSSLVAWILMLKAVFSLLGPYDLVTLIVVVIVLVNIVLFFCALWRLLVFVKELSLVVRIYAKIPDVENLIDFASDDCDDEDTAKDS